MIRVLFAIPFAGATALLLFSFMAWMVDNDHNKKPEQDKPLHFNIVMFEEEQALQRRQRHVPEQPKPPEAPQQTSVSQAQTHVEQLSTIDHQIDLGLDTNIDGLAISAPEFGDFNVSQQALPLYRVEPRYPTRALKRKIEGYVVMSFTISTTGRPTNIEVVDSDPPRMFERDAINALKQWKYQPKVEAGKAIAQAGQTVKLEFRIAR